MVPLSPEMELRVSPVVLPLFLTFWFMAAATVLDEIVPISRMEPSAATAPAATLATEQSTLLSGSDLTVEGGDSL